MAIILQCFELKAGLYFKVRMKKNRGAKIIKTAWRFDHQAKIYAGSADLIVE
jgi:hypothetical protein